jgi:hypothetical protein
MLIVASKPIMLSIVMLSIVMLSIVMLSIVILSVLVPVNTNIFRQFKFSTLNVKL